MSKLVQWMDKIFYPEYEGNWDDTLFRVEILKYLYREHALLDLGAGAGIVSQMNFRNLAKRVCGIDPDERVVNNPYLDEGKVAMGEAIPYPDNSFDRVIADNVLEHLPDPEAVLKEVARVLKAGGVFLAKTPNKNHYMPLIARLTPHRFHQFVNRLRGRASVDTFPTRYRINTPKDARRYAEQSGLRVREIRLVEGRPEYLRITFLTYVFGWLYERLVNAFPGLQRFRILMIVVLEKPGA